MRGSDGRKISGGAEEDGSYYCAYSEENKGFPDLDTDELFPMAFYRDGITFGASRQEEMRGNGIYTIRLGELEETEKNKSFRLCGISETLGRTFVWSGCYIQFRMI